MIESQPDDEEAEDYKELKLQLPEDMSPQRPPATKGRPVSLMQREDSIDDIDKVQRQCAHLDLLSPDLHAKNNRKASGGVTLQSHEQTLN